MSLAFRSLPRSKLFAVNSLALSLVKNQSTRLISDLKPYNTQISDYMRNGLVEEAWNLFDKMSHRNTVTWNSMIRGYFQNGEFDRAINFFHQMPDRDLFSYNTVIAGLIQHGAVNKAREVFDQMPIRDVVSWNSMIAGYVHNSSIDEALVLFYEMPSRNVISWNLVISGLVKFRSVDQAEQLFRQIPVRDVASWTIMISGLASTGRMVEAREFFEEMPIRDVRAWNAIIVGYIENGSVEMAEGLFHKMPEHVSSSWYELIVGLVDNRRINDAMRLFTEMPQKDPRSWNLILLSLAQSGYIEEAHAFFEKKPFNDIISWTNLVIGYFESGHVQTAVKLFEMMPCRDETAWNATIYGLSENNHGEEGLKFFIRMKEGGPRPDEATFTSIMTICSDLPSLGFGEQSHAQIIKTGFDYFVAVSNAIVTMYARCGNLDSALLGFSCMPSHDVISWNSIICAFAHHGNGREALGMFRKMSVTDVKPDQVTFVGVLSACSHAGLVDLGQYYFNFMKYKCFLQPTCEHYTCMVDLLGRCGHIEEAMNIINKMEADGFEVSTSIWGALLGACRIHKNLEEGQIAGEMILELEPYNAGVYIILAEMCLNSGRRGDAERFLVRMKAKGVKKQPGCSWIEVNDSVHVFLAGDNSIPEFCRMCCVLNLLNMEMEIEPEQTNACSS